MPRPRKCDCGECKLCKQRDYMRRWLAGKTDEERRELYARSRPARLRAQARQRALHPQRFAANSAVYRAVKAGTLRKVPCVFCGDLTVQAHHHMGYEREYWLNVIWLCASHHRQAHADPLMDLLPI